MKTKKIIVGGERYLLSKTANKMRLVAPIQSPHVSDVYHPITISRPTKNGHRVRWREFGAFGYTAYGLRSILLFT